MLWNSTHRDVHPDAVTYDELLEKTVAYASVVRQEDPEAVIAGPAEWGWTAYFYSAADVQPVGRRKHWDQRAHGGVPLLAWYLRKLREYERQTGVRLLDVVDVHFYPQCDVGMAEEGGTDEETAARRIRSTRALWDWGYKDESWIGEPVRLIPRLKDWIAENYPGRGISIGEYNFGATTHMSGGLAQAEALGRFAQEGITSAFHFTYPPDKSPAYWAFRAFRDYDGKGGRFLDTYVPTKMDEGVSLFASRDSKGERLVAIALNLEPETARVALVDLQGCGKLQEAKVFQYTGLPEGFVPQEASGQRTEAVEVMLPPYSMTVLELKVTGG
jgi:hypothetical protein